MLKRALGGLVLAAACLAGCSQSEEPARGPDLEARAAEAPRAEREAPREFAFLRYRIDVSQDAPELCLRFTAALDPEVDYRAYVAVEPDMPVAITASGETLCVGGLGFGEGQAVTLRTGLPSADGRALEADEVIAIEFGDRPAYVGIAGDGVILPRVEADGLAIETVNVDLLDIRLMRINDRALAFRSVTSGFSAAAGEYNWLSGDEDPSQVAETVWSGQMAVNNTPNTAVTSVFPIADTIGQLEAGAYFIEIDDAAERSENDGVPARSRRWLVITDLAFTAYRSQDGLDLVLRSLQSAQPVRAARVELIAANNEILARTQTGRDGRARFDAPLVRGEGAMRPRLLAAYGPEGDFALLDLQRNPVDLSGQNIGGRRRSAALDGYVWLDRGIYRPGETVHAMAMLRDSTAQAVIDRPGQVVLYGPNGIEAERLRFENAERAGALDWSIDLPRQAARGEWRLELEADGQGVIARESFSVEDFVPQRVALDLNLSSDAPLRAGETRALDAEVRFLYGAPGAGLPVLSRLRIETDPNPFPEYRDYRFGRHDQAFRDISQTLPETVADGAGRAVIALDPGEAGWQTTHPLRLRAVVEAIEPGGRPVADDVRLPYRPADLYVGLDPQFDGRARRDQENRFNVVALDAAGEAQQSRLDWQLLRIDWDYDWYRTDGGRWQWRRTRHVVPIETGELALDAASGELVLPPLDWGDYQLIVTDLETGSSASQQFWVGWGSRAASGVEAPDQVRVLAPDEPTPAGQTVTVTILPPYAGEAEVVIATDRVLESRSLSLPEEGGELSFRVDEDWGGGAYVMVSVFTPRDPVAQPRPRRAVGVAYLPVDVGGRELALALDAPELARPRQALTLDVQTTGDIGRDAWITIAAVDEGILALTRFASPDPADWYFGKTALETDLLDDYGRLLDPNQGAAGVVRSGGDQIGGAGLTVVPTRTVALFSGPVELDSRGRASVTLDIPDFNGELRLMAVAWSRDGVGGTAQALTVRDPVPAELILPRFLAPGDAGQATLTVDNVEGDAGAFEARIEAGGAVDVARTERFDLANGARLDREVDISGADTGIADIGLAVSGPGGFDVARSYPLEVRSAWLPSSEIERGRIDPGESWTLSASALDAYLGGTGRLHVSLASTPLDENALLRSLERYPYGCTEQITSRAMPLLYADPIADAAQLDSVEDARLRVQDAVATILNRQAFDGAIGMWRVGDRGSSTWLGVYATDFLSRARAAGYVVPDAAIERALAQLQYIAAQQSWRANGYDSTVISWRGQSDSNERLSQRSAAYALYVLAREGQVDMSRLRYMHDEMLDQIASPLARAHIGAALYHVGDRARARNAFEAAEAALGYQNRGDWYQTARRDLAGVLALAAEAGQTDLTGRLADQVAVDLPEPARLTTQEKAFLLLAAEALGADEALDVGGQGVSDIAQPAELVFDTAGLAGEPVFTNRGVSPVWITETARGESVEAPLPASEGVSVEKRVRTLQGGSVDLASVRQGDRLMVELVIRPGEERTIPAIIVDLLPAGFEIETVVTPSEASRNGIYGWLARVNAPRIAEARDDRFVAAIDLTRQRMVRLAYVVRAVSPGRYALPGAVVEDMYRPDVFARSAVGELSIAAAD